MSTIRFEDATAKAGIQFTRSFGAPQLGSLLEGTGAGCVWFDYNNDGLLDLYFVSGKPLEDGMHPYPLMQAPAIAPHNHFYRNNGDGTFTDVTDQAGVAANIDGLAAIAALRPTPRFPRRLFPGTSRTLQDDRGQGYTLARHIYTELGLKRVAILRVNDR